MNNSLRANHHKKIERKITLESRMNLLRNALTSKKHRRWIAYRIKDKSWQRDKLIEFGLRKPKSNS